jgi:hypothetical protein
VFVVGIINASVTNAIWGFVGILLASIPASAEAKNINFTSSETKPYFFYTAKKPRIASNVNITSNNKSSSIELNPALSNSKAAQKDKNDNTNKTPNGISNTSINYTNNKHNAKTKILATLGSGNIQIADIDQNNFKSKSKSKSNFKSKSNSKSKSKSKSSTKLLNRVIKDTDAGLSSIELDLLLLVVLTLEAILGFFAV